MEWMQTAAQEVKWIEGGDEMDRGKIVTEE